MRKFPSHCSLSALLVALTLSSAGWAEPTLRLSVDQRGDFVLFGNTLGWDCAASTAEVLVGAVECNGVGQAQDTAQDIYWSSDSPETGQALASLSVTAEQARSSAVLVLPEGAQVTYARLYYGAFLPSSTEPDLSVRLEQPHSGLDQSLTADASWQTVLQGVGGSLFYQASADVTEWVVASGPGAYRVSDVAASALDANDQSNDAVAGWAMVVFYRLEAEPPRNLTLFDGLDLISSGNPKQANLSGFLVPNAGFSAKLGVLTYEGDATLPGDQLLFNAGILSDAVNPADNFFNGTRSFLGSGVHQAGDLPELSGAPGSMGGLDLDVVDVTALVSGGDTSAVIEATSSQDRYALGVVVTSISTFKPSFEESTKTAVDLDGGMLLPGDLLEYTIQTSNSGNDASVGTILRDVLPEGVEYVADSLELVEPGPTTLTDSAGDDRGEYDAATRTITVRLGSDATAEQGGVLGVDEATTVRFLVRLLDVAGATVENQATVSASGQLGAPEQAYPTDGNGSEPGVVPTTFIVDACASNVDCAAPTPVCDTAIRPTVCVGCLSQADCASEAPDCNAVTQSCECAAGQGACTDMDQDGLLDAAEVELGTDPSDPDSDDDGVLDGAELAPGEDDDGDEQPNALDFDGDDDGLPDGTELGLGCDEENATHCVPDGDSGETTTDPRSADTDGGGLPDGTEDTDRDGVVDVGERDPNRAADDAWCMSDADCELGASRRVCDESGDCVLGCRGTGEPCPTGQTCTSTDDEIGDCAVPTGTGGAPGEGGAAPVAGAPGEGGRISAGGEPPQAGSPPGGSAGSPSGGQAGAAAGEGGEPAEGGTVEPVAGAEPEAGASGAVAGSRNIAFRGNGVACAMLPAGREQAVGAQYGLLALLGMALVGLLRRR